MRFKGTFILLVVFLTLGMWVYFTDVRGREERRQEEERAKLAIPIAADDITEVRLVYPDQTISAIRTDDGWQFTSPDSIEADSDEWDRLASNVPRIEREQTVATAPGDLGVYGLSHPELKAAVKLRDGRSFEIWFGDENPRQIYHYAKLAGSDEVFFTPSSWFRVMKKEVKDLRNRKVLEFEEADIDRIEITHGGGRIKLTKADDAWILDEPVATAADGSEVSTLLGAIRLARVAEFPDEVISSRAAGLDPPSVRIALHDREADADRILLVGRETEADRYYARDTSRDPVFLIDKDIPEKSIRPVFDWRDKTLAEFEREKIDSVEIVGGAGRIVLTRSEGDWRLEDGRKVRWDKVSGMFNSLEFDRAKDIMDAPRSLSRYGLENPRVQAILREGTRETLRVAFGSDSRDPEGVYIRLSGENEPVKVVSRNVFDKFTADVTDLLETDSAETSQ